MGPALDIVRRSLLVAIVLAQSVVPARGAIVGRAWLSNQINQTMCTWEQPRAAVLRDAFYLDGGLITYRPGLADGTWGTPDTPEDGQAMYMIDFTRPFNTAQNATELLQKVPKTAGPANNRAPNYYDGTLFANDHVLYLFGGVLRDTDDFAHPPATTVMSYERFQYGPHRERWSPGFIDVRLPDDMSRYITAGAGVNVPSENLGFYFGGLRRADWGEIRDRGNDEYNATVAANTLISVDMSTMRGERWANDSLSSGVLGPANAELVWIPVADRGALIALGGVDNPAGVFSPEMDLPNQVNSSIFMSNVSVYDVANRTWYTQPTTGDIPPQLTRSCSVVAVAKDRSSFNIYLYGGYSALSRTDAPTDDVYILSIPSFVWIKASSGQSGHGRRSHKCAKVYPDLMFVVGGQPQLRPNDMACLEGGIIQIFNLSTLAWQESYDPNVWADYQVPKIVTDVIGGTADGSASLREPSEWADAALRPLFAAEYTKTIPTYYPYSAATPTDSPTVVPNAGGQGSGTPSWVAPVLGVVLGLLGVSAILFGVFWYCRRHRRYERRGSHASTSGLRSRIEAWMQGTPAPKAPTVTSTEEPPSASGGLTDLGSSGELVPPNVPAPLVTEAEGTALVELADTSVASELPAMHQIGFTTIVPRRTRPSTHVSQPSSSSSLGTGVVRPESPTSDFVPGHKRQVSSLDSTDLPSPTSTVPSAGGIPAIERPDPMEEAELVSPVTPPEIGAPRDGRPDAGGGPPGAWPDHGAGGSG